METNVNDRETVFNDGENTNEIGKRAHVMKHSHRRCVVGPVDKSLNEGSIWTGHEDDLSFILHKSTFLHLVHHGTRLYDKYITSFDSFLNG